jgi:hypothetical protein
METKSSKNKKEKEDKKTEETGKIVNLCEDMNPHIHDEESYQKMLKEQESIK